MKTVEFLEKYIGILTTRREYCREDISRRNGAIAHEKHGRSIVQISLDTIESEAKEMVYDQVIKDLGDLLRAIEEGEVEA